ncbi:molybdate ABC transporter substrate-binding protein [Salmonella enterica subsp. enterica]|nr:molybdate ABC transporter substrate-binding protein [Salmonella enterica subsp. enterica]
MDYAADKSGGFHDVRETLLGNSPVVVARAESQWQKPFTIDNKTDWIRLLGTAGVWRWAIRNTCTGGNYAKEARCKVSAWQTLEPKLAPGEDVRGALALVECNEAPLGIVYGSAMRSPARGQRGGDVFPWKIHIKVEYPIAIVRA